MVKKLLTNKELRELVAKAQKGDIEARNEIVMHNGGLITRFAKLHVTRKTLCTFDDLFQEGVIGLIRAIETFDLSLKLKFSTYAIWWVKQRIYRALDNNNFGVRIPVHLLEKTRKVRKKILEYKKLDEDEHKVWALFENAQSFSMERLIKTDGEGSDTFHDILSAPIGEPQELVKHDLDTLINKVKAQDRSKAIMRRRATGETLRSIGKSLGLSRERIRQIELDVRQKIGRLTNK